jgi:hypothetical protein
LSYQANQVLSTFWLLGNATREKINAIYILDPKVVSITTTLQEHLEEHTWWICLLSALLHIRLENQCGFFFLWRMPGNQVPVFKDSLPGRCASHWATFCKEERIRKEIP